MEIFNTNTQPQKLTIPTVELIDFEEVSIHEENRTDTKTNLEDRRQFNFSQQVFNANTKELLRLDH